MPPSFVIFDLMGVLYDCDASVRYAALEKLTGLREEQLRMLIFDSGFEEEAEAGAYRTGQDYLDALGERLGTIISREDWIDYTRRMFSPCPDVLGVADALASQTELALLTNNGMMLKDAFAACVPDAARIFGDRAHVTAEFGARKPDPEAYLGLCRRYDHLPARSLFIDDSKRNVTGAEQAGLQALHFCDSASLRIGLVQSGFDL